MSIIDRFCRTDYNSYEEFYNNFTLNIPEGFNYGFDVVDEIAKENPHKTALVWVNDHGEEKILTFSDIKRMSDKTANFLKSLGIGRGDFVMLLLKRRYEYWYISIALHKLGASMIPATHLLSEKDIKYRIKKANVKMIIAANEDGLLDAIDSAQSDLCDLLNLKAVVTGNRPGYISFDKEVETASEIFSRPEGDNASKNSDILLAYFTSGTTGMPKMAVHDYTYPLAHVLTGKFWHNLNENDLHLTVADTGWAKASWGKLYGQWLSEAAIFVYDYDTRFTPSDFLELIGKYRITTFCAPPTIYRFLIKEDITKYDLSSLRAAYIAGEPLNPEVFVQWRKLTGLEIKEGYGQSESTVLIANFPWINPKPGSTGKPAPWYNIKLLDSKGSICEAGEEGEICIEIKKHPSGLFKGYYGDEELTKAVMRDGWYHTGDMAWMDEDGFYWFIGRNDDVIKSSGYRIGPFEIESALLEHPAVLETAITAVPDPIRGQIVKATIVLAKGYEPSEKLKKELQDHVKRVTAPYKYPRVVEFVKELPKTISGKIKRNEIRSIDNSKTK